MTSRYGLMFLSGLVVYFVLLAMAGATSVLSPDTAQTHADSTILWHQLRWLPGAQTLVASITFSNLDYVSKDEIRDDERFDFSLPGATFEAQSGTFFVSGPRGQRIPVAALRKELIGRSIKLLPGARMNVYNRSGKIHVVLLASETPLPGERWAQR